MAAVGLTVAIPGNAPHTSLAARWACPSAYGGWLVCSRQIEPAFN